MNILITGSEGFIGKNLVEWLKTTRQNDTILQFNKSNSLQELCQNADFVFHLAGVNRPKDDSEFITSNVQLTEQLLSYCKNGKNPPILFASSTQAELDNPYGKSKKMGENLILDYSQKTGAKSYIYRLSGIFGKWCKPNYNSVVATFCHNIANNLPIKINDEETILTLLYIDDCCENFTKILDGETESGFCYVNPQYNITLGNLAELLYSFNESRQNLETPNLSNSLIYKLYSTYCSYLNNFSYPLQNHSDERGHFSEFIKLNNMGQVSVNVTKPGYIKGNHWHHSKIEKFLTVSGSGVINFRKVGEQNITEYPVDGKNLTVVDIPPGYIHSLVNTGEDDLITIIWASEQFDKAKPDTFFEKVFTTEKETF
ncbi:MAG: NAD-dependent epimerase/dehydratase family protein [Firmicutes bacterium]|nr:NAD-dependent epimerase/dehydratase family protein [Bacillota bacterium]